MGGEYESCNYYPAIYPGVILATKVVTGVTATFSIAGSTLIILTYALFKRLRTTPRQLLVNLSVADILVAGSHFVGSVANYDRFIPYYNGNITNLSSHDPLCISQAAVTMYGSIALFLWMMSIAIYMLVSILSRNRKLLRTMVIIMYITCWGLPVLFVISSAAKKYFGYQLTGESGCYTIDDDTSVDDSLVIFEIFSYEIWVYVAYIILPTIYIILFCYIRCQKAKYAEALATNKTDIKLLLIPISFLLLRIWTTAVDAIAFYTKEYDQKYRCSQANAALLVIQAFGINAQGIVNVILFCFLTKQVRHTWYHALVNLCIRNRNPLYTIQEDTEPLEDTVELKLSADQDNAYGSIGSNNNT